MISPKGNVQGVLSFEIGGKGGGGCREKGKGRGSLN